MQRPKISIKFEFFETISDYENMYLYCLGLFHLRSSWGGRNGNEK